MCFCFPLYWPDGGRQAEDPATAAIELPAPLCGITDGRRAAVAENDRCSVDIDGGMQRTRVRFMFRSLTTPPSAARRRALTITPWYCRLLPSSDELVRSHGKQRASTAVDK